MKKVILISVAIIVLIFMGLTVYVSYFMDWNSHKERLSNSLSTMLGKKIEFSGNLNVSLLPHPRMSAADVQIVNPVTNEKLASIENMETDVTLCSLLKGTPNITSLLLENAEIWIKFNNENVSNWKQNTNHTVIDENNGFNLHDFVIKNATVHFNAEKYDYEAELNKFNADIKAESMDGPYIIDGNFVKDNEQYGMAFNIGNISRDDAILKFAFTHPKSNSYIRYIGQFNPKAETYKGDLNCNMHSATDTVNAFAGKELLGDTFNEPLVFSVGVENNGDEINLSRLVVQFGSLLEGSGDILIPLKSDGEHKPVASVKYQMINLDARPIIRYIQAKMEEYRNGAEYVPDTLTNVTYDLSAERVIVSDQTSRMFENVSAKGVWQDNELHLDEFYAACPGNIVLTMTANLSEVEKVPHYYVNAVADGQNFLSFINTFDAEFDAPTKSAYRDGNLSVSMSGTPDDINVESLVWKMDNSELSAALQVKPASKEIKGNIIANKVNLDKYIAPLNAEEVTDISSIIKQDLAKMPWLNEVNLQLEAEGKNIIFRSANIENVNTKLVADKGNINLEFLKIKDVLQSDIDLSGLFQAENEQLNIKKLNYNLKSQNVLNFADKCKIKLPRYKLFEQKGFVSEGQIKGLLTDWVGNINFTVDKHSFEYDGVLKQKDEGYEFDGKITVKTTQLENLLKEITDKPFDNNVYRGAFNINTKIHGNKFDFEMNDIIALLGLSRYTGAINIKSDQGMYSIKGDINSTDLDLLQIINRKPMKNRLNNNSFGTDDTFIIHPDISKENIDYAAYRNLNIDLNLKAEKALYKNKTYTNLQTHIINGQNVLKLEDLSFNAEAGNVSGNVSIDYIQIPTMSGNLSLNNFVIQEIGGSIYGFSATNALINAEFKTSAASFEDMLNNVSGTLTYNMDNFRLKGINLKAIEKDLQERQYSKGIFQSIRENLQSGTTDFANASGKIIVEDGNLQIISEKLDLADTDVTFNGNINLKDWRINSNMKVKYLLLPELPEYSFTLSGALNKPTLETDVEDLAEHYDAYWKEVSDREKAQKDEVRRILSQKMDQLQDTVHQLADRNNALLIKLENISAQNMISESSDTYNIINNRLHEIGHQITEMQYIAKQTEYSADNIKTIESDTEKLNTEITRLESEVNRNYINDVEAKFKLITNRALDDYNSSKRIKSEYRAMIDDDIKQLEAMNSVQYITNNIELKNQQSSLENYENTLENMYNAFTDKYKKAQQNNNIEEKIAAISELEQDIEKMQTILSQMYSIHNQSSRLLLQIINECQQEYKQEQDPTPANTEIHSLTEDEIQITDKAKAEAKSKISDTTELKQSVQNITKQKPRVSGKIIKSYEEKTIVAPTNTEPSLLKPTDGEVQKATGTITTK